MFILCSDLVDCKEPSQILKNHILKASVNLVTKNEV